MTSPLLDQPGAVAAPPESIDAAVPWHHGDPLAEQRYGTRGAIVVDRSNRDVLVVPGEDRLGWLNSLTTQLLTELADGSATQSLVLDVHGRVQHHVEVSEVDGQVWLDTEPGQGEELLSYLQKMQFWSKVEPAAAPDTAVLTVLGPSSADVLAAAELPSPGSGQVLRAGDVLVRHLPLRQVPAVDLLVPRDRLVGLWTALTGAGARPAGTLAFEALRAESLRPRLGVDTDANTIPHEVGWIGPAVRLNKGCYRGQETVSKVANVGRPPRRLLLLHLDGSVGALPETGDDVELDGRPVGRVGTVAQHHELGPIALALVKRSVPVGSALTAAGVAAAIDPDSVPPDTGEPPGRAAIRALRAMP
ncbi:MAG TPA: folate-binding protein [Pseudonocardiaceae bacterium]|nr:folate-binding protein [Pseudonocardiaceae bacterium]